MTVKVVMERSVSAEKREQLMELLMQLRAKALLQPGYISGETLVSVDRPGTHLVISTWHSLPDWKAWENHPERLKILIQIESILSVPSKTGVFVDAWASSPQAQ